MLFLKVRDIDCSDLEKSFFVGGSVKVVVALCGMSTMNFGVTHTSVQIQVLWPISHVTLGRSHNLQISVSPLTVPCNNPFVKLLWLLKEHMQKSAQSMRSKNVTHSLPPFCQLFSWLRSAILKMWLGPYHEILFSSKFINEIKKMIYFSYSV